MGEFTLSRLATIYNEGCFGNEHPDYVRLHPCHRTRINILSAMRMNDSVLSVVRHYDKEGKTLSYHFALLQAEIVFSIEVSEIHMETVNLRYLRDERYTFARLLQD